MAHFEDLVRCGYLEMKLPRKRRKIAHKAWKKKWFVLRRKSPHGQVRLETYNNEKSCSERNHRTVINLEDLISINTANSRTRQNAFQLHLRETKLFLSGETKNDSSEWIRMIKKLALPDPKIYPPLVGSDFYEWFEVTVIRTDDSDRLGLVGNYLMTIKNNNLSVHNCDSGSLVTEWELACVPRFRLRKLSLLQDKDKILELSIGSESKNGKGEFEFLTRHGRQLADAVKYQIQRLENERNEKLSLTRHSDDSSGNCRSVATNSSDESRSRSISLSSYSSTKSPVYAVTKS